MIWLEGFYLAIATVIFVLIFIEGKHDPFAVRLFGALVVGAFWSDWIDDRLKGCGK